MSAGLFLRADTVGLKNTLLARVVNMAADESVLGDDGKIDTGKIGMIFYESFSNSYFRLGEKVGKA